jgi:hypothetical protein
MRILKLCFVLLCALCILSCATQRISTKTLPKGVVIKKGIQIPNTAVVRYYLPHNEKIARSFNERGGFWIEPGKGLVNGSTAAFAAYFPQAQPLDINKQEDYGLLIDMQPTWDFENGKIILKMNYRVLDGKSTTPILTGEKQYSATYDWGGGVAFYNASLRTTQVLIIDILNKLEPTAEKYPAVNKTAAINIKDLANMEKPVSLGTGFYFNSNGQLLTANHVLDECLIIRIQANGKELDANVNASSSLLDLAVLNTGTQSANYLPLRKNQELILGEMVSSVGYPLQGLLAETPNLTRGNISAKSGMKGSLGLFQFSAPIQPGTSGGPIVSESGQLLGVTVSTLNSKFLIEKGILPQNVNFGLDAKYIARFMRKHQLSFAETNLNTTQNIQTSNDAALAASVRVACYQ